MLIRTMDGWALPTRTVRYTRNGEEFEQIMGDEDEQWWHNFAEKWPETEIIGFADIEYTAEQLARLEEIQEVEGRYQEEIERYVLEGIIPDIPFFQPKPEEVAAQTLLNTEFLVILAEISPM